MMNFIAYILPCFILFSNFQSSFQNEIQYVEFFSSNNCTNITGKLNDTDLTLSSRLGYFDANSVRVNGMWRIFKPESATLTSIITGVWSEVCVPRGPRELSYAAVERFGPLNQGLNSLSLYTEPTFSGIQFSPSGQNTTVVLPRQLMVLSWYFTGVEEWSVYPNTDFTGDSTCLKPTDDVTQKKYGFSWAFRTKLVVGSAKMGCAGAGSAGVEAIPTIFTLSLAVAMIFRNAVSV